MLNFIIDATFVLSEESVDHLLLDCTKTKIVVGVAFLSIWHHVDNLKFGEGHSFELYWLVGKKRKKV